jgi:hypothetical protein
MKENDGTLPDNVDFMQFFRILRSRLQDSNWNVIHQTTLLVMEMLPGLGLDLDIYLSMILPMVICNLGSAKVVIRTVSQQFISQYAQNSSNLATLFTIFARQGLDHEDWRVRQACCASLNQIVTSKLSTNFDGESMDMLVQETVNRLRDVSHAVATSAASALAHLNSTYPTLFENALSSLSQFQLDLYRDNSENISHLRGSNAQSRGIRKEKEHIPSSTSQQGEMSTLSLSGLSNSNTSATSDNSSPSELLLEMHGHGLKERERGSEERSIGAFSGSVNASGQAARGGDSGGYSGNGRRGSYGDGSHAASSRLVYGFVSPSLCEELADANWQVRAMAIEQLHSVVGNLQDYSVLISHLSSFMGFLLSLLDDPNFKISLTTLQIIGILVDRVGSHLKPYLQVFVPNLVEKLGDNKIVIRQANFKVLSRLVMTLSPKQLLPMLISSLGHRNWHIREEIVHLIVHMLLSPNNYDYDYHHLVSVLGRLLEDSKPKVCTAALDCLAVIHSQVGNRFDGMVPVLSPQAADALTQRLRSEQLPIITGDGLVEGSLSIAGTGATPTSSNFHPANSSASHSGSHSGSNGSHPHPHRSSSLSQQQQHSYHSYERDLQTRERELITSSPLPLSMTSLGGMLPSSPGLDEELFPPTSHNTATTTGGSSNSSGRITARNAVSAGVSARGPNKGRIPWDMPMPRTASRMQALRNRQATETADIPMSMGMPSSNPSSNPAPVEDFFEETHLTPRVPKRYLDQQQKERELEKERKESSSANGSAGGLGERPHPQERRRVQFSTHGSNSESGETSPSASDSHSPSPPQGYDPTEKVKLWFSDFHAVAGSPPQSLTSSHQAAAAPRRSSRSAVLPGNSSNGGGNEAADDRNIKWFSPLKGAGHRERDSRYIELGEEEEEEQLSYSNHHHNQSNQNNSNNSNSNSNNTSYSNHNSHSNAAAHDSHQPHHGSTSSTNQSVEGDIQSKLQTLKRRSRGLSTPGTRVRDYHEPQTTSALEIQSRQRALQAQAQDQDQDQDQDDYRAPVSSQPKPLARERDREAPRNREDRPLPVRRSMQSGERTQNGLSVDGEWTEYPTPPYTADTPPVSQTATVRPRLSKATQQRLAARQNGGGSGSGNAPSAPSGRRSQPSSSGPASFSPGGDESHSSPGDKEALASPQPPPRSLDGSHWDMKASELKNSRDRGLLDTNARPLEEPNIEDLAPSANPTKELATANAQLKSGDWEQQFHALTSVKRLCRHHAAIVLPQQHALVLGVLEAAKSLRSFVAKAAINTLYDIFGEIGSPLDAELTYIAPMLLRRAGDASGGFIHHASERALSAMVEQCSANRIVAALLPMCDDRSAAVRAKTAITMAAVLKKMAPRSHVLKDMDRLMPALMQGLKEGNADSRRASRLSLYTLCESSGGSIPDFCRSISPYLSERQNRELKDTLHGLYASVAQGKDPLAVSLAGQTTSAASVRSATAGSGKTGSAVGLKPKPRRASSTRASAEKEAAREREREKELDKEKEKEKEKEKDRFGLPEEGAGNDTRLGVRGGMRRTTKPGSSARSSASSSRRGGGDAKKSGEGGGGVEPTEFEQLPSLLSALTSNDWRQRYESLTSLTDLFARFPTEISPRLIKIFDLVNQRLNDVNSKVQLHAIGCLQSMVPALGWGMEPVLTTLIPALAANLASTNVAVRSGTISCFHELSTSVDKSQLLHPYANVITYGNPRVKPVMLEQLKLLVPEVYHEKPSHTVRCVLPAAVGLLDERKADIRTANNELLAALYEVLGEELFIQPGLSPQNSERVRAIVA